MFQTWGEAKQLFWVSEFMYLMKINIQYIDWIIVLLHKYFLKSLKEIRVVYERIKIQGVEN